MKVAIEMPQVNKCAVETCAYNTGAACHAKAITIGDHSEPACDTFFAAGAHPRLPQFMAGVGACKVAECRHNADYECTADRIEVGIEEDRGRCLTFSAR